MHRYKNKICVILDANGNDMMMMMALKEKMDYGNPLPATITY